MTASWNAPKQERSLRRFDQLLESAAVLFAKHGIDVVSTNHIAEHASIPIGSLYQFFPSKESLLAALIDQYTREMAGAFPAAFDPAVPFEIVVGGVVDALIEFDAQHAAFGQLLVHLASPRYTAYVRIMQDVIVTYVELMLGVYFTALNDEQRRRCALVGFGVVKGLSELTGLDRALLATEITTVLIAYVHAFVARETTAGVNDKSGKQ